MTPKEKQEIENTVSEQRKQLPSLMKIYMNANSMKYQDFVEWMRNYKPSA